MIEILSLPQIDYEVLRQIANFKYEEVKGSDFDKTNKALQYADVHYDAAYLFSMTLLLCNSHPEDWFVLHKYGTLLPCGKHTLACIPLHNLLIMLIDLCDYNSEVAKNLYGKMSVMGFRTYFKANLVASHKPRFSLKATPK